MSEFKIDIRKVANIKEHPNADSLEIIEVEGLAYTIISQISNYKVDDFAFVFQSDSVMPSDIIEYFKLGFLHKGNRVKEVKLRGVISQALLLPMREVFQWAKLSNKEMLEKKIYHFLNVYDNSPELALTLDFAEELGVTKYEVPETFNVGNARGYLPLGVEKYDLENAERETFYFDELYNKEVIITEKLEGTNFAIHIDENQEIHVCSRQLDLKENEDNTYWRNAIKLNLPNRMQEIRTLIKKYGEFETDENVTLRGELIGQSIQGNIYNLNEQTVFFFDIKYGANYVAYGVFRRVMDDLGLNVAPVVWRGVLSDFAASIEELKTASNDASVLYETLREGIVIRPVKEMMSKQGFTRLIFKQRSPEYLAKQK